MKYQYHTLKCLAALVVGAILTSTVAHAVDFHVTTAQELQNALTLAAANGADDVIYMTNGYYIGNFNYNSAEAGSLTLQAEPGTTNTDITIDGAGTGRSMNISCSANATITVRGITFLRNCGSTSNAGLRIGTGSAASVLVEDCRFISPASTSGMGLELTSGQNATVRQCTVAGVSGGGGRGISISSFPGNVTVGNCTVTTNSSRGLYIGTGAVCSITNNTFTGNYASYGNSGGGFYCSGTTVIVRDNMVVGNGGYPNGGGAHCSGTTVTVTGNIFTGNSCGGSNNGAAGGGIYCSGGTVTVSNNVFNANSGSDNGTSGGGAGCSGTTVVVADNTFAGNSVYGSPSSPRGGGVWCSGTTTLSNNVSSVISGGFFIGPDRDQGHRGERECLV